jgi:hypothetical protein
MGNEKVSQAAISICSGLVIPNWMGTGQDSPLKIYHSVFFKGRETLLGYKTAFISDEYERVSLGLNYQPHPNPAQTSVSVSTCSSRVIQQKHSLNAVVLSL